MAPLSFFKSDKSSPSAAAGPSTTNTNIPITDEVPAPTPTTQPPPPPSSFTSRLLRRKPSSKSGRANNGSGGSEVESAPPSSTSATFDHESPTADRQSEDEPPLGVPRQRRGSEPLKSPGGTNRTAWIYGRHSGVVEEGEAGENVIIINGSGRNGDDQGLGDLFRSNSKKYRQPPSPTSSSSLERRHVPVALNLAPTYPTALSPPRRPMPRSPTSSSNTDFPISSGMLPSISAVNPPPPLSPSPMRRPSANAEWLARKPSSRRSESSSSAHNPLHLRLEADSPRKLGGPVDLRSPTSAPMRNRTTSSSTGGDADASSADSEVDGEVGIKRGSRIGGNGLGYEVAVGCKDERDVNGEITWEVKIRPRRNHRPSSDEGYNSAIPFNLSTSTSTAISPPTASSINLSLSLDQPTGKLVFIAFPMDIHATPRHRPTPSQSNSQSFISPPMRPSTPPPSAPRLNSSPPPSTPSSKRVANANTMWPSPSTHGRRSPSGSSVVSPRSERERVATSRRSRLMNADELNGGLYARGTVDGMSEELESSLNLQYKLGEVMR